MSAEAPRSLFSFAMYVLLTMLTAMNSALQNSNQTGANDSHASIYLSRQRLRHVSNRCVNTKPFFPRKDEHYLFCIRQRGPRFRNTFGKTLFVRFLEREENISPDNASKSRRTPLTLINSCAWTKASSVLIWFIICSFRAVMSEAEDCE